MDIHIPTTIGKFTDLQATMVVGAILAFITPYVSAVIIRRKMSDGTKIFISGFIAFLAACITVTLTQQTATMADAATAFAVMWPISQTFFKNIASKLGIRKLEEMTSPASDRPVSPPLPTGSTTEATAAIISEATNAPERVADAVADMIPAGVPDQVVTMTKEEVADFVNDIIRKATGGKTSGE